VKRLDSKVVIITGASAGIGEASARLLAREGATVVLAARRQDRLEVLKQEIEAAGGRALAIPTDVNLPGDRQRLVDGTMRAFGRIDALVNNAGYGQRGPIELVPLDSIRQNFETNFFSVVALTQLVVPIMRKQRGGRIINISSVAGRIARPLSSVYDATKHALEAVSDGLRGELAPFGIKVVVIQPGFILTEFQGLASELVRPIVEANSPYAPFFGGFAEGYRRLKRIAGHPEDIASVVVDALTTARPRRRYAAPRHARVFLALRRWLPQRLFDHFLDRQTGVRQEAVK
jgi:short-subunit dehydrogenase